MSVSNISGSQTPAQKAIAQAKAEIQQDKIDRAVKVLKDKYRQLDAAKVVVANIEREITDAEAAIEQGSTL